VGLGFSGQGIINRARLYSCLVFILVFLYIFYFGAEPLFLGLEAPSPIFLKTTTKELKR
jgi:hypothetical protein